MKLTAQERALEKVVRKEHPGLLDNLPGEKKQKLLRFLQSIPPEQIERNLVLTQTTTQITSSPVPPAELLIGYNSAFPDGANRLFTLVENQSAHRQRIEDKVVNEQLAQSKRGQIFAFICAIFFGSLAGYLAVKGFSHLAGLIVTVLITSLVGAFIWGQKSQTRSLDKKNPDKPATGKKK